MARAELDSGFAPDCRSCEQLKIERQSLDSKLQAQNKLLTENDKELSKVSTSNPSKAVKLRSNIHLLLRDRDLNARRMKTLNESWQTGGCDRCQRN